jgi:hypothetical protein
MNPTSKINRQTPCTAATVLLLGLVTFLVSAPTQADSITIGYSDGASATNGTIPGLKLTLPTITDPDQLAWELTAFTWLTVKSTNTATGRGSLWIFDAEVFTSPAGLKNGTDITEETDGFIARSATYTNGNYSFSDDVILEGGKSYYFLNANALGGSTGFTGVGYNANSVTVTVAGTSIEVSVERWSGNGSNSTWGSAASIGSPNFSATFVPVPVPEPATITAFLGLTSIALFLLKRRR